jgi:hypothetical protein
LECASSQGLRNVSKRCEYRHSGIPSPNGIAADLGCCHINHAGDMHSLSSIRSSSACRPQVSRTAADIPRPHSAHCGLRGGIGFSHLPLVGSHSLHQQASHCPRRAPHVVRPTSSRQLPSHVTSATAAEQQNGSSRRQIELTDRQKDAIRIATTTRSNMFVTGPGGSVGCRVVTVADDVVHYCTTSVILPVQS